MEERNRRTDLKFAFQLIWGTLYSERNKRDPISARGKVKTDCRKVLSDIYTVTVTCSYSYTHNLEINTLCLRDKRTHKILGN